MKAFFAWIRHWARTAYAASTRVEFYRQIGERKTSEALGHLAMLAVIWTLPLSVMFFIALNQFTNRFSEIIRTEIPQGTVFEMKSGVLGNNLEEPLVLRQAGGVVIINTASSTVGLAEGENGVVINPDGMEQREGPRSQYLEFKTLPNFSVNREELNAQISKWAPLALFVGSLFLLVFMFLAFWSSIIFNALLHGFALWLLLKAIKRPRPWRDSFIAASYAATVSILLHMVLQGFEQTAILPDAVYWGFIAWIAYDAYKGGAHERKKQTAPDRPGNEGESGTV